MLARLSPLVLLVLAGCATFTSAAPALPSPLLIAASNEPALFLRPEADAARIGFLSENVQLELAGSEEYGRVPVRVEGALRARGYVQRDQLMLRVQRRGRVRGTPVYLGPGDRVSVVGFEEGTQRLRVRVTARLGERALGSYDGTYPAEGLGARVPAADAQAPEPGRAYVVPAQLALALSELPGEPAVTSVAGQDAAYEVRVLNESEGWLAVRVGTGPYLVGWVKEGMGASVEEVETRTRTGTSTSTGTSTDGSRTRTTTATSTGDSGTRTDGASTGAAGGSGVPARLVGEAGELRRVGAGSKVMFGEQVIGVFKTSGWVRVLKSNADGYSDVFAAADDELAIRGLMRTVDLLPLAR